MVAVLLSGSVIARRARVQDHDTAARKQCHRQNRASRALLPEMGRNAYVGGQARPFRNAKAATAVREETPSLAKMWSRWVVTVRSLTTSASAISRLVLPWATRRATSTSRSVRPPGPAARGR